MSRMAARTYAFHKVYRHLMSAESEDILHDDLDVVGSDNEYAEAVLSGVIEHFDELQEAVELRATGYAIDRIYKVDLAILLVAAYEIMYTDELSQKVASLNGLNKAIACNAAVELAKKYSTIKSPSFINGVLAKINSKEV